MLKCYAKYDFFGVIRLTKTKIHISLILNCLTASMTVLVIILLFFIEDPVLNSGWESFLFFTTDANILTAVASVIVAYYDVRILRGKADAIPKYAELLKYTGVVSLMLTFATVMLFLVPNYGVQYELGGTNFHMHLLAPMMSTLSFLLCEKRSKLSLKESLLGLIPTAVYAAVYYVMVISIGADNGGWNDFYSFNQDNRWFPALIVMMAATFAICMLVSFPFNAKKHMVKVKADS